MDASSRVWYNDSYTIATKPIRTLELHYTMIQFLINVYIPRVSLRGRRANAHLVSSPRHVYSNMASGSDCAVTISTWRRVGYSRSARLITTNYEQCLHLSE